MPLLGGPWRVTHGGSSFIVALEELLLFTEDATDKSKLVSFRLAEAASGNVKYLCFTSV